MPALEGKAASFATLILNCFEYVGISSVLLLVLQVYNKLLFKLYFLGDGSVYPISLLCLQIYGEQFVKILLPYPNDLKSCGSIFEKNSFCTQPPLYVVPISRNTASVPKPDSFHELAGRPCELHPCELHSYALHPSELPL
jgi:hypothetical protein